MQKPIETEQKRKNISQAIRIIGTVLSTLLFIWVLRKQDWKMIWENLGLFPIWLWPVCLALVITGMLCNSLRWYVLLHAQKVQMPFKDVVRTVFAGAFASNFLPSTIGGDAFRLISVMRFTSDKALGLASLIVDRALNVAASLSILPFSWFTFGNKIFELMHPTGPISSLALIFPSFSKIKEFSLHVVKRLIVAFKNWTRQPLVLVGAFGISWISILVIYIEIWLLALFLGIPVSLLQVMGVAAIVYLVTLLPISFNGYGVREVMYTTLFVSLGATVEQAAALALVSRFFMLLETLPGALWLSDIIAFKKNPPTNST